MNNAENNFEPKKTAKAVKISILAVIFVFFSAWIFISASLRYFLSEHPGLIAVFVGVAGEVYFDWREEKGTHSRWKKFFMALLVCGLAYELYEASESDRKAADAIKLAGQANERASSNELQVAMLTSNNLELQLQFTPRILEEFGPAQSLKKYKDTEAIVISSATYDCPQLANNMVAMLEAGWWNCKSPLSSLKTIPDGVSVGLCPMPTDNADGISRMLKAIALIGVLNKAGIDATFDPDMSQQTKLQSEGVVILIGLRPPKQEVEIFNKQNRMAVLNEQDLESKTNLTSLENELTSLPTVHLWGSTNAALLAKNAALMQRRAEIIPAIGKNKSQIAENQHEENNLMKEIQSLSKHFWKTPTLFVPSSIVEQYGPRISTDLPN